MVFTPHCLQCVRAIIKSNSKSNRAVRSIPRVQGQSRPVLYNPCGVVLSDIHKTVRNNPSSCPPRAPSSTALVTAPSLQALWLVRIIKLYTNLPIRSATAATFRLLLRCVGKQREHRTPKLRCLLALAQQRLQEHERCWGGVIDGHPALIVLQEWRGCPVRLSEYHVAVSLQ